MDAPRNEGFLTVPTLAQIRWWDSLCRRDAVDALKHLFDSPCDDGMMCDNFIPFAEKYCVRKYDLRLVKRDELPANFEVISDRTVFQRY